MTVASLRAVTHRMTATPARELPQFAQSLASSLGNCADVLANQKKDGRSEPEVTIQVHKLKTRLNSLLQDRSFEGRWAAVVLVKATVEAGQLEVVRGGELLVRSLISILGVCRRSWTLCLCGILELILSDRNRIPSRPRNSASSR